MASADVTVAGSGQRPETWLSPCAASSPTTRNRLARPAPPPAATFRTNPRTCRSGQDCPDPAARPPSAAWQGLPAAPTTPPRCCGYVEEHHCRARRATPPRRRTYRPASRPTPPKAAAAVLPGNSTPRPRGPGSVPPTAAARPGATRQPAPRTAARLGTSAPHPRPRASISCRNQPTTREPRRRRPPDGLCPPASSGDGEGRGGLGRSGAAAARVSPEPPPGTTRALSTRWFLVR